MGMTSNKPYLVRAFYDWIVDNNCTPYVVVDAGAVGVEVPQVYVADGQIVLNVAPRAVTAFNLDNKAIRFNTRFGGVPTDIYAPMDAIIGIYARENNEGMAFEPVALKPVGVRDVDIESDESPDNPPQGPKPSGPTLRVVK